MAHPGRVRQDSLFLTFSHRRSSEPSISTVLSVWLLGKAEENLLQPQERSWNGGLLAWGLFPRLPFAGLVGSGRCSMYRFILDGFDVSFGWRPRIPRRVLLTQSPLSFQYAMSILNQEFF